MIVDNNFFLLDFLFSPKTDFIIACGSLTSVLDFPIFLYSSVI
nr:MAG TPA: hypothetical protein [Caudoviricetes sp.]